MCAVCVPSVWGDAGVDEHVMAGSVSCWVCVPDEVKVTSEVVWSWPLVELNSVKVSV